MAFAEVGRFKEAVEYVQKAAKALYEAAKDVFEHVKATVQHLIELFIEAVARVLAWIDEHKAYLFLTAAVTAGAVALSTALNIWGLVELEKLAYAAVGAPLVAGLADAGGKAAERFSAVAERWRVGDNEKQKIEEIINAPQKGRRPYEVLRELPDSPNLPPFLARLKEALEHVKDEAVQDAAVIATLVLYKTLINNVEVYGKWAELYKWARGLVERQEFTVTTNDVKRLHETHRRLEEVAKEVRKELNRVLSQYSRSDFYNKERPDLLNKLKQLLEVNPGKAEELAEARSKELSNYSDVNMGTKAYAALLSIAKGGIYGHAAMLLMIEGALADIVISTPGGAYDKAGDIANARGEAVDPSYSGRRGRSVGQPSWEDRAASTLLRFLIGYGETDLKFRLVEKEGRKGFQVFKTFGGVEAPVGELWIEKTVARFNASKEELERLVEEAKRTAPDLSGLDKARQYLEWRTTDVSASWRLIVAATAHPWQLRWYFGLLGKEESFDGRANVTKEGRRLNVTVFWPRESENQILRESRWLKSLLDRTVNNWRELVDAIDWSWVLKKVEELADKLKPWIGPKKMDDAEREELVRRMLGELKLLVQFVEARRGMDDDRWREERAKRLAKAVEDLSGGRIAGEYADRLAQVIIYYAESHTGWTKRRIENLAKEVGVSEKEVWGIVERILSGEDPYAYCLATDCARDAVVRKFVAPALELIMLEKALDMMSKSKDEESKERIKKETLLWFGEMYATAVAGDGSVGPREIRLAVGGELGGGAVLLRLATLHLLNQLLPDELKFNTRIYVMRNRCYYIATYGENAARFMRLLAVSAPSAGGEYLSPKFDQFVEEAKVEVRVDNIKQTKRRIVADLTISVGGIAVEYNVYIRDRAIELKFASTDRSHVELAALLLKLAGVNAEVKKVGKRNVWEIYASTDKLAAGREELRKALADFVREAIKNGGVDKKKAERWLKKLESGVTLMEGWPKFLVRLDHHGSLEVRFASTNPDSIEQVAQWLEERGLERGVHFTVTMPEEGGDGYVRILKEGLAYAAWLSEHSENKQQRELAAAFVEYILKRAEKACGGRKEECAVYKKAKEIVEEGKAWGSIELKKFEKEFEVNGKKYKVKITGGEAVEEEQNGKTLLRIKIKVEMSYVEDGHIVRVEREYIITFSRRGRDNETKGFAVASADAPGGREKDAERLVAVIKALTGEEPRVYHTKYAIIIVCGRKHLDGFMRYIELADTIKKWLEKTSRRRPSD